MCLPFVIVMYESLNCPQCEKMGLKSYSHCWKGFKSAKDAGKPENVQDLEDFSEEKWAVEQRTPETLFLFFFKKVLNLTCSYL